MRMLAGLLAPDEGTLRYLPPHETGYLPEKRGLHQGLPVRRMLVFFAMLRGLPRAEAARRADAWLERVGLQDRGGENARDLPDAARRRLEIATALIHRPAIALLDEGFTGLDPGSHDLLHELVVELKQSGAAVLMTSSELHADERLSDGVVLLNRGREVLSGSMPELRGRLYAAGTPRLHDLFVEALRDDDRTRR
jgi:ABC-2 type transport system ATP-binding protein